MTAENIGFFGCTAGGFLDLWNCARTLSYVKQHSNQARKVNQACCVDAFPWITDDIPDGVVLHNYTNPVDDNAWWYDQHRPESAGFFGMQVIDIGGMSGTTSEISSYAIDSCGTSIRYESPVPKGYTITVEALLHGLTCCAVAYGLRAIRKTLAGCCSSPCDGASLKFLSCVPEINTVTTCGGWTLPANTTSPWRSLRNVKMIDMPEIVDQTGPTCGNCGCAPITKVTFTLQSNGDLYLDPRTVYGPEILITPGSSTCLVQCPDDVECDDHKDILYDPACDAPILAPPPDVAVGCGCDPLIRSKLCTVIDLGSRMFDNDMTFVISSKTRDLKNLKVQFWRWLGDGVPMSHYTKCNVCTEFSVSYVPKWSTLTFGSCGTWVDTNLARRNARSIVSSRTNDQSCTRLQCGKYVMCITADALNTSELATIEIIAAEVEP